MILGQVIKDFPYPEKLCPYCNAKLVVVNAIHWQVDKYQFKALYLDPNGKCPVYNDGARKAYARIYYSSEDAFNAFRDIKMPVRRWEQEDLLSVYQ